MSTKLTQNKSQLYSNPWLLRFVGFEMILLVIALLNRFIIQGSFGYLFYAMTISLLILIAIVGLLVLVFYLL